MKSISLPIQNKIDIILYIKQYNSVLRYSFNRLQEGKNKKEITKLIKSLNNIELLNSWLLVSAFNDAEGIFKKQGNKKVIFGGKDVFKQLSLKKISKQEWIKIKQSPITSIGEGNMKGNRNFTFDIIKNNQIIFKPRKGIKIYIQLPKLRKNIKKELEQLEILTKQKRIPVTIRITHEHISILFDEKIISNIFTKHINYRIASVDLNPNYIGFVIKDYTTNKIILEQIINLKIINDFNKQHKSLSSSNKKCKWLTNKRINEIFHICKYITNICYHYGVSAFAIEDLNIISCNKNKGTLYNKLVNNMWNRTRFVNNLTKRCNELKITIISIYPQYSSFIGSMMYPDKIDSISAAHELNRRCSEFSNRKTYNITFPIYDKNSLLNVWKDEVMKAKILSNTDWVSLYKDVKKSKLKYRLLFDDYTYKKRVFRLISKKSYIDVYNFDYE